MARNNRLMMSNTAIITAGMVTSRCSMPGCRSNVLANASIDSVWKRPRNARNHALRSGIRQNTPSASRRDSGRLGNVLASRNCSGGLDLRTSDRGGGTVICSGRSWVG